MFHLAKQGETAANSLCDKGLYKILRLILPRTGIESGAIIPATLA